MARTATSWTAPHASLIVRRVPSGNRRLHKTESAPATISNRWFFDPAAFRWFGYGNRSPPPMRLFRRPSEEPQT